MNYEKISDALGMIRDRRTGSDIQDAKANAGYQYGIGVISEDELRETLTNLSYRTATLEALTLAGDKLAIAERTIERERAAARNARYNEESKRQESERQAQEQQ